MMSLVWRWTVLTGVSVLKRVRYRFAMKVWDSELRSISSGIEVKDKIKSDVGELASSLELYVMVSMSDLVGLVTFAGCISWSIT